MRSHIRKNKPIKDSVAARALAPLAWVLELLLGLMVIAPVAWVPLIVWGSGSFLGIGDDEVCISARPGSVVPDSYETLVKVPGFRSYPELVSHCATHPSTQQFVLQAVRALLPYLLTLVILWLLYRSIQQATRHGLFEAGLPRRLVLTGLLLSLGEPLTWAVICVIDNGLLHQFAGEGWQWGFMPGNGLSFAWIVAGLGLITLGRVMRFAVVLREEYEATV